MRRRLIIDRDDDKITSQGNWPGMLRNNSIRSRSLMALQKGLRGQQRQRRAQSGAYGGGGACPHRDAPSFLTTCSPIASKRAVAVLAIAAGMAFAPCALADGVIVKSGSPSYPVGRVIQTGETVSLRDGESVSLMARSGEMFDLAGTRVFEEPAASRSASLADTARALAQGPRATGRIGGVRNDKMQACLNDAERRNLPTVDHCFEKAGPAPRLSIIAPKVAPETPAGARQYLKLSANFSGYGLCVMRAPGRDPVFLPGAEPARPLLLQKGLSLSWPSRGETGLVSDSAAPDALLTCHAVPEILWLASPGAIEAATPANVSALLTGLSRLHAVETASASARLQRIR